MLIPYTVPRLFGVWWVIWNRAFPNLHPLPVPLLDFQLSLSAEDEELAKLLMDDEEETSFGATVCEAWEETNERLGELMLFCWAFTEASNNVRNCIARCPKPTITDAKRQILADLAPYGHLGAFTVSLVDRHLGSFKNWCVVVCYHRFYFIYMVIMDGKTKTFVWSCSFFSTLLLGTS